MKPTDREPEGGGPGPPPKPSKSRSSSAQAAVVRASSRSGASKRTLAVPSLSLAPRLPSVLTTIGEFIGPSPRNLRAVRGRRSFPQTQGRGESVRGKVRSANSLYIAFLDAVQMLAVAEV